MQYGDKLPDIAGEHVLMVDFSLTRAAMLEAQYIAKSIVVLDHHETAEAELASWAAPMAEAVEWAALKGDHRGALAVFDMDKSGARLAWEFCHPGKPIPRLLEHIEDRDLYRFKLQWTKEISAALRSYDHEFHRFDSWIATETADVWVQALAGEGVALLRAHEKIVADLVAHACMTEVAGFTVPTVNVPPRQYASDCGHALLKKYPDAPFAATWVRSADGKILWSLRSEKGRENVATIAAKFKGGGHAAAAGFSTEAPELVAKVPETAMEAAP
jgi:oligoribonuclease NrnB/cAMP/cGMP phosphodiesterase (DHH superfamily)